MMTALRALRPGQALTAGSVPDGFDAMLLADAARALAGQADKRAVVLVHVARDGQRMAALDSGLAFVARILNGWCFPHGIASL